MDSWHRLASENSTLIGRTGIPRNVLSRLLNLSRLGVGSSVLDVGCGGGELIAFLDSLGIHCAGIDESPHNVVEARRRVPQCEVHCAVLRDRLPGVQTEFDLVLVRQASDFRGSLLSRTARSASQTLLERVRRGGCLGFLPRLTDGESASPGHRFGCYTRHVESLDGEHEFREIPDGSLFTRPVRSVIRRHHITGYGIALVRVPSGPTGGIAAGASDSTIELNSAACCAWAGQTADASVSRSKAA